jgi:spore germination protein (amino acid permease)
VASNGKISLRQAMFLFLVITYTPVLRIVPISASAIAKQAAWLAPVASFALALPVIVALKSIFTKHQDKSFTEILEVVFGRLVGKMVTLVYILFFIMLTAINSNSISEQLTLSLYTSVNPSLFVIVMLAIIAFSVYKGGLTVVARMGEIILPVLVVSFLLICALAGQNIKLHRLTPVSYLDIVPAVKASFSVSGVQGHLPMLFLLGNFINNKDKIAKYCTLTALIFMFLIISLLVTVIGSLGAETTANAPLSFLTTVKLVSLFESIERIEPVVVMLWILSDFVLVSVLLITMLNMFQSLVKLSKTRNFIVITLIVALLMGRMIGRNMFEVQRFLELFLTPSMIAFGYLLPLAVFITGKVRKLL